MSNGWGGSRSRSGPRGGANNPETYDPAADDGAPSLMAQLDAEKLAHERVKREQREFKLAVERGEYLPRDAVRQASATALAVLSQALRTIPDNVERQMSLAPEVITLIERSVDAALSEAALAFKVMAND